MASKRRRTCSMNIPKLMLKCIFCPSSLFIGYAGYDANWNRAISMKAPKNDSNFSEMAT